MQELKRYLELHKNDEIHFSEIVNILKQYDEEKFSEAIQFIPKDILGDVALELPDRYFDDMVQSLDAKDLSEAVKELESDDQVDFMQELKEHDEDKASKVFESLDKNDQKEITLLESYDEAKAGAYMQVEVFTATEEELVSDVIKRFSKLKKLNVLEHVHTLFITAKNSVLLYSIDLDDLLTFDFSITFAQNIKEAGESFEPISGVDTDEIKEVVNTFKEYDLFVMPIVTKDGKLIGRITSDDIHDIISEQATEQMYHLAGLKDDVEEDEEILKAGKQRASWLGVNLVTAIFASIIIGLFSDILNEIVALAILMPIVASMGGNAGTQTLTVVVRQLTLRDISSGDAKRIIFKEVSISLLNGLLFAIIIGVIASLWFDVNNLGYVIALSMLINLLLAGFFGATIPLVLEKMKIDPAIASTVILTTVTDVVGFFSFLGLATIIL
ncbi:MAG: Mg/Co/Ni transporter MgtE / CBS domain [uncultured Sulfurovum sp.]|uniref:Magnesium transporter MgtE n=1 Tax=uncultured Sulfurovum sp. TaxID=269237 RepID=A0A6S6T3X4_9BACT|nr:MAG: Mg/Co/Ni transporter MgtE / CBS domain [uncultured Sulfurovum sp.]